MKKIILLFLLSFLLLPAFASADLNTNLYYGLQRNSDVRQLQEFLIAKGFLKGNPTGSFFSLTLKAVKYYQADKGINSTGYVGLLTRTAINKELAVDLEGSNQDATKETGTTPPATTPAPVPPVIQQIQQNVQQLQQTVQEQSQVIQQIQQSAPTPTPAPVVSAPPTPPAPIVSVLLNAAYPNRTFQPNTSNEVGAFAILNVSKTDTAQFSKVNVSLNLGDKTSLANFSSLFVKFGSGKTYNASSFQASNDFNVNETLAPGQSETVNVYASNGADSDVSATLQTILTVEGVSANGQVITFK